jgi:hypothetical protein
VPAPKAPLHPSLPFSVRLFSTAPFPPAVSALLLIAAWTLVFALYTRAFALPFAEPYVGIELLQLFMIGFTPAATVHALRGAARDFAELKGVLDPATSERGLEACVRLDRRRLALAGAAGIAIALGLLFAPGSWLAGRPSLGDPVFAWAALRSSVLGWLVMRTVVIELAVGFAFARLGERALRVDWLDPRPLAPFARKGLRSVLLLLLFWLWFSLFLLAPWGRVVALPMLVLFPALCVAALLLPVSGVHRRLVAAKGAELARLDGALHAEAEVNLTPAGGAPVGARLANLVAYRGLVEAANTWPFDFTVWLRFVLYVTLGVGSWLGAALVERVLGALLD